MTQTAAVVPDLIGRISRFSAACAAIKLEIDGIKKIAREAGITLPAAIEDGYTHLSIDLLRIVKETREAIGG